MNKSTLDGFPNLNTLIIRCRHILGSVINEVYKGSPLLKRLHLHCDEISKEAFADMPGHCNGMIELALTISKNLTEDDLMYIVRNTPNNSFIKSDRSIVFIYNAFKKLETLEINASHLRLTDAGMEALVYICINLRNFDVLFAYTTVNKTSLASYLSIAGNWKY